MDGFELGWPRSGTREPRFRAGSETDVPPLAVRHMLFGNKYVVLFAHADGDDGLKMFSGAIISERASSWASTAKRTALLAEGAHIEAALGSIGVAAPVKLKAKAAVTGRPTGKGSKNERSRIEAVLQALGQNALGKDEILAGIKKLGYKFTAKNPTNSLNTLLYGKKPKFKNDGGKFSVA